MTETSLVFPAQEYRDRAGRLQAEMRERGLAALLLTSPADIFYTTGFLTRFWESPARPWFVVLGETGDPVAVIPSIGAALMERTWVSRLRTWQAPDPEDDGVSLLVDTICSLTPEAARIGVPMGPETSLRMPLSDFRRVSDRIAPRAFVDATAAVQRVREIKSEPEVAAIRRCCGIAGRAFDRVPETVRCGQPLERVYRDFQISLLAEGADWVSYLAGGAGPDGYGDVISPAGSDPVAKGDILMLDTGAVKGGYFCDFDRNFAIGPPSDAVRATHAALWQASETVLAALRPGLRACDVHRLLHDELVALGVEPSPGRFGHGLGVTLTEWPSFTALDTTELREGMVLTLEPSAVVEAGRILVHEENVVLRAQGAELLSPRAPAELPVIAA